MASRIDYKVDGTRLARDKDRAFKKTDVLDYEDVHITRISGRRETHLHERVIVDLHPTGTVGIVSLERLGERLDHDAGTHKAVECDPRSAP